MKVLHISGPARGGIASHIGYLCRELLGRGVECQPLTVKVGAAAVYKVQKEIRRGHWDLVHCHGFQGGVVGRLAAALETVPVIVTLHNTLQVTGFLHLGARVAEKSLGRRTGCWLSVSQFLSNYASKELGIPAAKIHVIATGVEAPTALPPRCCEPVIGTVARLIPSKGVDVFLRAVQLLRPEIPGLRAVVIGDGPERKKLMALSRALGLAETVNFLGYRDDIQVQLQNLAAFVLATRSEGLGISILEAMAAGVPVVATAVGGVPELIKHTETGLLVRPEEHGAIARAVRQLLRNEAGAEAMRQTAYDYAVQRHNLERMIDSTYSVYCQHAKA